MTGTLTRLTLLLTAVVVVVLATYLILIAASLIRANRNLGDLVIGLEAIRDNTRPLAERLGAINSAAGTVHQQLQAVNDQVQRLSQTL